MIRNLGKLFLTLCLLTVGGGIVANAQIQGGMMISDGVTIQGNVPFTFVVGSTTLPAGKYEIKRLDDNLNVLELRSANGRIAVLFETEDTTMQDDQASTKTELVFDKVGDKYFLSQIFVNGSNSGSQLAKSKMEKRLEGGGIKSERQSIAANLKKS